MSRSRRITQSKIHVFYALLGKKGENMMRYKHFKSTLLIVSVLLLFAGCKKSDSESGEEGEIHDEIIPEEIIQLLDDCPTTHYTDIRAFGFHYKDDSSLDRLFSAMCNQAIFLTKDLPYGDQKGLAYVYGYGTPESTEKDYRIPRIGSTVCGEECKCQDSLYGLDCSGFIAHVMNAAGIKKLSVKTANEQVNYFKNLKKLNTSLFKGEIKVKEIKDVSAANIQNGDIIYKTNAENKATHIGIFFKTTNGKIIMFQSSGSPKYSCEENRHENGRGPIQKELSETNLNKYFSTGSGNARLLRITPMYFFTDTPFDNTKWSVPVTFQSITTGTLRVAEWHSSSGGYYTYHTESYSDSNNGNDNMSPVFRNNTLVYTNNSANQSAFDFRGDSIYMTIKMEGIEGTIGVLNEIAYSYNEENVHTEVSVSRWFSNKNTFCLKIVFENTITENYGSEWQQTIKTGAESVSTFSIDSTSNKCSFDTHETSYIDVPQYPDFYEGMLHQNTVTTYHGMGTWAHGAKNEIIISGKKQKAIHITPMSLMGYNRAKFR